MNLPLIIDQNHDEFLKVINTRILEALLTKLNFIIFPLINRRISFEKIKFNQILFIGCPTIPFENSEIQDSSSRGKSPIQTNFNQ